MGWEGRESLLRPPLPRPHTSRNGERRHSANSQNWHKGSSYCLNSGERPGVLLERGEGIFTKALPRVFKAAWELPRRTGAGETTYKRQAIPRPFKV